MIARYLWGPWEHEEPPYEPYHHPKEDWIRDALHKGIDLKEGRGVGLSMDLEHDAKSDVLTRYRERTELDNRAAEYLNLVEGQTAGPSCFTAAAATTLVAAAAAPDQRSCRRRHG